MKTMTLAALAVMGVGFVVPASAMPVSQGSGKYVPQLQVVQVDMWNGSHNYWRRHHRRDNDNFRFGFGLGFPLALGAPFYGNRYYGYEGNGNAHVEYCLDRYRSYDPRTNSFMGYDGFRHECISPYM
jgi:hypothetical protein